jgi:hypothetical protein
MERTTHAIGFQFKVDEPKRSVTLVMRYLR